MEGLEEFDGKENNPYKLQNSYIFQYDTLYYSHKESFQKVNFSDSERVFI